MNIRNAASDRSRPHLADVSSAGDGELGETLAMALAPLHEAPQDPAAWTAALAALARAVPCRLGTLVERLGPAPGAEFGLAASTDARYLAEYQREFHRLDPFAAEPMVARMLHLGRAVLSGELLRDAELLRSAFYSDFLSRHGDLFHAVGGTFRVSDDAQAQVWLLRPRGQPFGEGDRRRMEVFFAHARAALRQRHWLAQIETERDAALAWMDCWGDPTYVLDAQGRLLVANLEGERLLRSGDPLALQGGRLVPARSTEPDWVGAALRDLLHGTRRIAAGSTRCLVVPGRKGLPPLHAVLACVPGDPHPSARGAPRAALILRDVYRSVPQYEPDQLQDLFGFTAAETRVANALLVGRTVEDIARHHQVRSDTIRSHIKRMLAKTGTRRQGELQKILVKALPNLRGVHRAGLVDELASEAFEEPAE